MQKWTYKVLSHGRKMLISTTQQTEIQPTDVVADDDDVCGGNARISRSAATGLVTQLST